MNYGADTGKFPLKKSVSGCFSALQTAANDSYRTVLPFMSRESVIRLIEASLAICCMLLSLDFTMLRNRR